MLSPSRGEQSSDSPQLESLRQDALRHIGENGATILKDFQADVVDPYQLDLKTAQRLIEELQIHQVELELQNDELRATQQELELSRDRYEELYNAAPVGYLSLDEYGHISSINKTACKLLGLPANHYIGRSFSSQISRIDEDRYYEFLNQLYNELPIGESTTCELRIRCAGYVQNYVELTGVIHLEPIVGKRQCRLVMQDIQQRKKLEERQRLLQAAVEYSTDGISISDMRQLDNPIIYVSPKLEEISGYTSDELIGGNWRLLYQDEPDEDARAMMREALSLGKECRTHVRNLRKDGTPFYCEVTLYPLTDEHGLVTHYVSVIRDETERRKANRAIQQAQRLDSIGILAGGIAHDFNNILQGILVQGMVALQKLEGDHPARYHLERGHAAVKKAADLTRQLLAYAGRGNFEVEQIDFNQLISETQKFVVSSISPKIEIATYLADETLFIEADRGQIQQILLNLIINAAEAISDEGRIEVRSRRYMPEEKRRTHWMIQNGKAPAQLTNQNGYVLLEVEDNGCGMDEETLAQIFDPFFTTKARGHGLGLAAALGVIHTHHGKIQVESRLDVGTKFSVFMPLAEERVASEPEPSLNAPSSKRFDTPPVVLVIDDDDNVRDTLDQALAYLGCEVIAAQNGFEGVAIFEKRYAEVDLALIDYHMPGMDGERTFHELRKINAELRCIFSSGFGPDKTRKKIGHDNGRIEYLQKPYDLTTLLNSITTILEA